MKSKYSFIVGLLIAIFFTYSYSLKISESLNNQKNCICAYDGFGYYMYLPAVFSQNTLKMKKEWAQGLQNEYCDEIYAYQLIEQRNGNNIDVYHMGLSFVQLPSYLVADIFAKVLGYKNDGFSKPYQIAFLINALLFILFGIYYLRKLLLLFFNEKISAVLLLVTFFATNYYFTALYQYDLAHVYLFTLNTAFLLYLFKYSEERKKKYLIFSAIILGLTFAIRPTQVIWGVIPLIYLYNNKPNLSSFWKEILLFPLFAIIWNIPHLLYWKIVGGELFLPNLHTEEIILTDPNLIDFLFSYRKGWLLYTPVFILSFIGFFSLYKKNKLLFWSTITFSFLYIYILSSWECWWYASSFGSRPMTEAYPLLILPIGYLLGSTHQILVRIMIGLFIASTLALNLFQSEQCNRGILHHERMTKDHYWYIFGKLDFQNFNFSRLSIDINDTNWIENQKSVYRVENRKLFKLNEPITSKPFENLSVGNLVILDELETDESLIEINLSYKTSSSSQSTLLQLETCSKFNCYDWKSVELSLNETVNSIITKTFQFNLQHIRHNEDYLQMYLYNPNDVVIKIHSFEVRSKSIIRE